MKDAARDDDRIDLFLADADKNEPVLDGGLPAEATRNAPNPKPKKAVRRDDTGHQIRADADPNILPLQRWSVVAPEGREGDALLEAMAPLIKLREEEQQAAVLRYRAPSDLTAEKAVAWKDETFWPEGMSESERPYYALLLGDLHHLPVELQNTLANGSLVGRVHFSDADGEPDLDGYAAYAEKVVRFAREATPETSPEMVFYVARDGTSATQIGDTRLVRPSLEAALQERREGKLEAADIREIEAQTVDNLLEAGGGSRPSVLLSVSHGMGPPRRGFRTVDEQQRRQGALVVGPGDVLDAERIGGKRFLPGGLWFFLACFGAGTPKSSVYATWLSQLAEEGAWSGRVSSVIAALPASGQRPFIAAMPQAALRNPEGPLGIIGHLDLAWTYGFSGAKNLSESRKSRILTALKVMARGSRVGVALDTLMKIYRETNDTLMTGYELEAAAGGQSKLEPAERIERGHLWMLRNDLRGYVLLGDPAARLPLKQNVVGARASEAAPATISTEPQAAQVQGSFGPPSVRVSEVGALRIPVSVMEAAVMAMIRGDEAGRVIAARAGVSIEVLWKWVDKFREGGRERLALAEESSKA